MPPSDPDPSSVPQAGSGASVRVCLIDLGTNSFHAVIVDAYPGGAFTVLDRFKEMVRLGEQGLGAHKLTKDAMERAFQALLRIRNLAEGWDVAEYLAFATSAIREADNGGDFIVRVREEMGLNIRPISGMMEADLIYKGVRRAVEMPEPALLVDIGGGSTEFVVGTGQEPLFQTSFKIGAARMTEQYITTDPVEKAEFKALRARYRNVLKPVFEAARAHGVREIIGSSGTMENLAQVYVDQYNEGPHTLYNRVFEAKAFRQVTKQIMKSSLAEREALAGIDPKRVSQVVAGAVLVDVLLKDLEVDRLRLSPHALREGMAVYFIEQNYQRLEQLAPYADVRRRSVYELGYRCQWEDRHVHHVADMALHLFDACDALHQLGVKDRELLEYAALLHDIGYHISRSSHHKHSLYLIRHADLRGFQPEEIDVIAFAARYHRGALPKKSHTLFQALPTPVQERVLKLAAFLRLAEGLDRSHFQNVTSLRVGLTKKRLRLTLETKSDPQLDVWGTRRSADLFEHLYGRKVVVWVRPAEPVEEAG